MVKARWAWATAQGVSPAVRVGTEPLPVGQEQPWQKGQVQWLRPVGQEMSFPCPGPCGLVLRVTTQSSYPLTPPVHPGLWLRGWKFGGKDCWGP